MKAKNVRTEPSSGWSFLPGGLLDEPRAWSPAEGQTTLWHPGTPAPSLQHDAHTQPQTCTQVMSHTHVCVHQETQLFVALPTTIKHFDFRLNYLLQQKGHLWATGKEERMDTGVTTTSTKWAGRPGCVQLAVLPTRWYLAGWSVFSPCSDSSHSILIVFFFSEYATQAYKSS